MQFYTRKSVAVSLAGAALLGGCSTVPLAPAGSNGWQALGEMRDYGPQITPLEVIEDSRCPATTDCGQAGTIKILTRITLFGGDWVRDEVLAIDQHIEVADGSVALVAVLPVRKSGRVIAPGEYLFAYRFDGGL